MKPNPIFLAQMRAIEEAQKLKEECSEKLARDILAFVSLQPAHEGFISIIQMTTMKHGYDQCRNQPLPSTEIVEKMQKHIEFKKSSQWFVPGFSWKVTDSKE